MNAIRLAVAGSVSVLLAVSAHAATEDSGTIKTMTGEVRIERSGSVLPAKIGDGVKGLDRLVTGKDSSVGITLRDETLISTGANSVLAIDRFAFDSKTREGALETSLLQGTLRFVSGIVAKLRPQAVLVRTPTATIGIRGTDFIVEIPNE